MTTCPSKTREAPTSMRNAAKSSGCLTYARAISRFSLEIYRTGTSQERRTRITSKAATSTIASMITAIRRTPLREINELRESPEPAKLNLQYLQVWASRGQMPPQFGQDCANILSDIVEK